MDPADVLWIGGPEGSRVSDVARALAQRFDLQLYLVDEHAAAHGPRLPRMLDESFLNTARHRFRLVLEDLRALPDTPPAVVAGPQLLPTSVAAVLRSPDHALFLVPDDADDLARRYFYEARDLQLTVLRGEATVDRAAQHFAAVLSAAAGTSPSRRPTP